MTASLGAEVTPGAVPGPGRHGPDRRRRRRRRPGRRRGRPGRAARGGPRPPGGHPGAGRPGRRRARGPRATAGRRRRLPDDVELLAACWSWPRPASSGLSDLLRSGSEADGGPEGDGGRRARALNAAGHLAGDLARIAARTADEVAWVDGTSRAPVLRLSPIDVGPPLAAQLWDEVTAVLTSATIPPRLAERLGLAGFPVDELDVGSPFDYRQHALLYVARHLPDRRRPESEPAIHEELAALITAAGGRTLALFTSRRATEAAAAALRGPPPLPPPRAGGAAQGPAAGAPSPTTSRRASSPPSASGRASTCRAARSSLVTLDRLPFPRPDDPLLAGPARAGRRGGLPRWSTCRGRPPCWPRARAASSARPTTGASWRCSTRGWPPPATAVCSWPASRRCAGPPSAARSTTSSAGSWPPAGQ